ncbi:MAG TPA: DUF2087 domain-containing protein [Thermotogota bacterium]|nr:DUF2087 domain-containing protein [Thermotogota bacterium]HRW93152.1 DUF2087 domain-containing protein [Thermotogota bacterium]
MEMHDLFWDASVDSLSRGVVFVPGDGVFACLVCGRRFEEGEVFPVGERYLVAEKACQQHVQAEHGGVFAFLSGMDRKHSGLSEIQLSLLQAMRLGKSNREIAREMGISESTVRNHRFRLREKARQAKVFLALWELAGENVPEEERLIEVHKTATMVDERYAVTRGEEQALVSRYFRSDGSLENFPPKQKAKMVILRHIAKTSFASGETYTETQVNHKLMSLYEDYVMLRRYLVEYGFLDRTKDGTKYWVPF